MGALFDLLYLVTDSMQYGVVAYSYLDKLPADVQPHALAVVEWILKLMGW